MSIHTTTLLSIFLYMVIWFFICQIRKNNGLIDIGWGLGFVVLSTVGYFTFGGELNGQRLLLFLVAIWGLRLTTYLFVRNWNSVEDWRYQNMRERWGKNVVPISFLRVFMLQGTVMFVVSLPLQIVFGSTSNRGHIGWQEMLGAGLWLLGFLWESIGDLQLYNFKQKPENKGKIMKTGLWAYSRHPNYFGEILLWWGFFLFALPYGTWYISFIGPFVMTYFLVRISGVPMLERKYKGNAEYDAYKERTYALFPKFW